MKTLDEIFGQRKTLDDIFSSGQSVPEITPEIKERLGANKQAYAQRMAELDKEHPIVSLVENEPKTLGQKIARPIVRGGLLAMQGVTNAALNPANPFGVVTNGLNIDTKPVKPETWAERGIERSAQYANDAAALNALGVGALGALGASSLAPSVAKGVLGALTEGGVPVAVTSSTGAGMLREYLNPRNEFEGFLTEIVGAGAPNALYSAAKKTTTNVAGGLKNILSNDKANAVLSKGIKADKTKGVARQINKEAPAAYNELNSEMSQALDDATGRKLNIDRALDTQQQRYNDFVKNNAGFEVFGEKTPLENFTQGLNEFQENALNQALNKGATMSTNAKGSLGATHRAQEVLNDMIDASYDTSVIGQRRPTTETRQLMTVKERLNQILEPSGVKPYDAGISKAKGLRANFEKGYNFKPSETKFENLGLDTLRDKRAFLQGRLAKLQDNVLSDGGTNLATAIKKDENTLRKLMPKSKFETLMNKADRIEENFKRLKSIQSQADREVLKDIEMGGSPWRENIESRGSMLGRALDIASGLYGRRANTRLAKQYLNPETTAITERGGLKGLFKGAGSGGARQLMIDLLNN